jgi:hypothetical protein
VAAVSTGITASVMKNGATFNGNPAQYGNTEGVDHANLKSGVLQVNPGDYFELYVTTGSSGASIAGSTDNQVWFAIEEVR